MSEKYKLLQDKDMFEVLNLRDKTVSMIDLLYWYMKRDPDAQQYRVVDVGVGWGWIPLLLKKYDEIHGRKIIKEIHGIDVDPQALKVSKQHAKDFGLELQLHKWNLLLPLDKILMKDPSSNIVISANLPYNTELEWDTYDEVVRREPKHAIVSPGEDGLDLFRDFLQQLPDYTDHIHMVMMQSWSHNHAQLYQLCQKLVIPWMSFYPESDNFGKQRFIVGLRHEPHEYDSAQL